MSDLEKLLQDIWERVCKKAEEERERKKRKGEYYNVFNVIGLWSEEVRLHSAFIADLLNPKGDHGAGDEFLKAFLKCVPAKKSISEDYLNVNSPSFRLSKERPIEHGQIDIIAEDGKNALIIENKIYAKDQETQLFRYYNYAKERKEKGILRDYKLIYLTLYGHEPSKKSTKNKEVKLDCICMSYKDDIIPWLTECADIASKHNPTHTTLARVGETIKQYIYLIKQLTYSTMDDKELKKVANIATEDDNIATTTAILQALGKISATFRDRFIFKKLKKVKKELEKEFKPEKFELEIIEDDEQHPCIKFSKKDLNGKPDILILIKSETYIWDKMFVVVERKGRLCRLNCLEFKNKEGWSWEWVYGASKRAEPKPESDWESPYSFANMTNYRIADWLKEKIKTILDELARKKRKTKTCRSGSAQT